MDDWVVPTAHQSGSAQPTRGDCSYASHAQRCALGVPPRRHASSYKPFHCGSELFPWRAKKGRVFRILRASKHGRCSTNATSCRLRRVRTTSCSGYPFEGTQSGHGGPSYRSCSTADRVLLFSFFVSFVCFVVTANGPDAFDLVTLPPRCYHSRRLSDGPSPNLNCFLCVWHRRRDR